MSIFVADLDISTQYGTFVRCEQSWIAAARPDSSCSIVPLGNTPSAALTLMDTATRHAASALRPDIAVTTAFRSDSSDGDGDDDQLFSCAHPSCFFSPCPFSSGKLFKSIFSSLRIDNGWK